MKLIIFGSTGGTGRALLKQALDQGHNVTAYARDPAKIEDIRHLSLKTVYGDVLSNPFQNIQNLLHVSLQ